MAAEYVPFGVMLNLTRGQWCFGGEPVLYFEDVLPSNGVSRNSGNFSGSIRMLNGTSAVDVYTVRDYDNLNEHGNGTLTDVRARSPKNLMRARSAIWPITEMQALASLT